MGMVLLIHIAAGGRAAVRTKRQEKVLPALAGEPSV
jgi:hypothetical protein